MNIKNTTMRNEKIHMINLYGSPNVYSQFQPHVVLGYDDKTRAQLRQAVRKITLEQCDFSNPLVIGMVKTGPRGTAPRKNSIWTGTLSSKRSNFWLDVGMDVEDV
jgi:hypothetical protein